MWEALLLFLPPTSFKYSSAPNMLMIPWNIMFLLNNKYAIKLIPKTNDEIPFIPPHRKNAIISKMLAIITIILSVTLSPERAACCARFQGLTFSFIFICPVAQRQLLAQFAASPDCLPRLLCKAKLCFRSKLRVRSSLSMQASLSAPQLDYNLS